MPWSHSYGCYLSSKQNRPYRAKLCFKWAYSLAQSHSGLPGSQTAFSQLCCWWFLLNWRLSLGVRWIQETGHFVAPPLWNGLLEKVRLCIVEFFLFLFTAVCSAFVQSSSWVLIQKSKTEMKEGRKEINELYSLNKWASSTSRDPPQ